MTPPEIDELLARTLDDRRLSRGEGQAIGEILADFPEGTQRVFRQHAFETARAALADPRDRTVLDWLEDVLKVIQRSEKREPGPPVAEAYFSPGEDCPRAIGRLLAGARKTVEVCVFTIADDRLAAELLAAHRRGVVLRIISDNDKAFDLGSDIHEFGNVGIPVRLDRTRFHMHHKFAIFDASMLLTGSFNWTRSASRDNEENMIVTGEPRLVSAFAQRFERLWTDLA